MIVQYKIHMQPYGAPIFCRRRRLPPAGQLTFQLICNELCNSKLFKVDVDGSHPTKLVDGIRLTVIDNRCQRDFDSL